MIEKRYLIKQYGTNCGKEYIYYVGRDCIIIGKYGALPLSLGTSKAAPKTLLIDTVKIGEKR